MRPAVVSSRKQADVASHKLPSVLRAKRTIVRNVGEFTGVKGQCGLDFESEFCFDHKILPLRSQARAFWVVCVEAYVERRAEARGFRLRALLSGLLPRGAVFGPERAFVDGPHRGDRRATALHLVGEAVGRAAVANLRACGLLEKQREHYHPGSQQRNVLQGGVNLVMMALQ